MFSIGLEVNVAVTLKSSPKSQTGNAPMTPENVMRLRKRLRSEPRNLLFLEIAMDTGLPATKLLRLKVRDLLEPHSTDPYGSAHHREALSIGPYARDAFERYLLDAEPQRDDYLFPSRKGKGPLNISSASRMVNKWFKEAGIDQASGLLSLRKAKEPPRVESGEIADHRDAADPNEYQPNRIQPLTTQEQVYRELENAILTGLIKPGQKLVAEELSRQMGISRIPVREAIGRLEVRSLVQKTPQKGAVVAELSESNIMEIQELRLMLELPAARKAAERMPKAALNQLLVDNQSYIDAWARFDAEALLFANKQFHYTVYKEAGMPILMRLIDHIWSLLSPYYHIIFRQTRIEDPRTGPMHHQRIIQGLWDKNVDQVEYWLKKDLEDSSRFVIEVMKSFVTHPETP